MKRVIRVVLALCMTVQLSACSPHFMEPVQILKVLEDVTGSLGATQITGDRELIGERLCGADAYTGRYLAECDGSTGKDVVFGGASIEPRRIYVSGYMNIYSGTAVIRIRMNDDVMELEPDEDGYFETELDMESGGNYIMVRYEDFTGTVDLTAGYESLSAQGT